MDIDKLIKVLEDAQSTIKTQETLIFLLTQQNEILKRQAIVPIYIPTFPLIKSPWV